ncbi:MAG: hypothetical protein ACTH1Z_08660 [Ancrocorticia sp.]|uniref:hypothetical protein n=1 Tax=Ancrocorticia sp. TaxID=2593684 RepID=UPI003F91DE0A
MQTTEIPVPAYPGEDPFNQFEAVEALARARYEDGQSRLVTLDSAREMSTAYTRDSVYERHFYLLTDPAERNFDAPIALLAPGRPAKILGYGYLRLAQEHKERSVASFDVVIHPDSWGKGYEDYLFDVVRNAAKKRGAKWLTCRVYMPYPAMIDAPIPQLFLDQPASAFLTRHGFALTNTFEDYWWDVSDHDAIRERMQHLIQPGNYQLRSWRGVTPPELLQSLARFRRQFTMDEQQGSPEVARTEYWTAGSLANEDEYNAAVGQTQYVTAAMDDRGEVVGFSSIVSNVDSPEHPVQAGTIVRPEHRGQNLGITLKAANILNVIDGHAQVETITTGVDPANEHLVDINAHLGFERTGLQGEFRKKI